MHVQWQFNFYKYIDFGKHVEKSSLVFTLDSKDELNRPFPYPIICQVNVTQFLSFSKLYLNQKMTPHAINCHLQGIVMF